MALHDTTELQSASHDHDETEIDRETYCTAQSDGKNGWDSANGKLAVNDVMR